MNERSYTGITHPIHVVLLSGTIPLFLGAALSDGAYSRTYEVQWANFASWLILGGLVFAGLALLFAIFDLLRADRRWRGIVLYVAVLLAMWVMGFFNALMHARDAWASMPAGLVLSVLVTLLACVATWIGLSRSRGATL
jgi:uncharacterized membrane protein